MKHIFTNFEEFLTYLFQLIHFDIQYSVPPVVNLFWLLKSLIRSKFHRSKTQSLSPIQRWTFTGFTVPSWSSLYDISVLLLLKLLVSNKAEKVVKKWLLALQKNMLPRRFPTFVVFHPRPSG